ncbi:hypothetical protein Q0812_07805 [Brevundimonas sp. 2R-24]|uniref:Thioredoxin-like fold domain-containing protein n=1 Tax=Peiella sedimenti TaxID=3061083 RepID=A0ABT8SL96_9CAUL|nr:hypothetical protein [Caulobacteraceae bacterium XZ-24]
MSEPNAPTPRRRNPVRRFLVFSLIAAVIGVLLAGGGYWAYWNYFARYRPVTLAKNQAEIQRLLESASWIAPLGEGGDPVWVVTYRDCASCRAFERQTFEALRDAGRQPRVIVFARPDREGMAQSTAAERATVAELWLARDPALYQRWTATPSRNWTAAGLQPADGNLARSGVVETARGFVAQLEGLLSGAGVSRGYPIVIWRDAEGHMKACACSDERSFRYLLDDVGADRQTETAETPEAEPQRPDPLALPDLPPPEPAPGAEPQQTEEPADETPSEPRAAPQPQQTEDTVFY